MKREGNILIEVMASLFILSLIMLFGINTYIYSNKVLKERKLAEEVDRTIYNLINEVKYNSTMDEMKKLLLNKELGFKFNKNISKELLTKKLENLTKGNDIKISLIKENNYELEMQAVVLVESDNFIISKEKNFSKLWWMEYAKEY
ncbi:hypothetical protein [Clostridium weizhouense]|uniref:N-terminal cleavage protein n=1 Tax=Clostridium weizhouense TaxID=2859781 RepID=A0ABS7AQU7_9CLOT|nr:hypothetical protein [Clostridium weizhouense]MBW6410929.1 hypothetical protein [Clostridium weizhouense]